MDIDTEIFLDGFRDKIFDTKIVAALRRHISRFPFNDGRQSAVEFFTAAVAQGALLCFDGILTLKYSQPGFGTRYLTPRSSPHWEMHLVTYMRASYRVQSNFSLLP
jgi:hypothetical protein